MDSQTIRAPQFPPGAVWLGVEEALRLEQELRGRIVLLDFWTYSCVNCLHTLPTLSALQRRFTNSPVQILGVHAAKFDAEKELENIRAAMQRHRVDHPVMVDNAHELWEAYGVKAWPTLVLLDAEGYLRARLPGESTEQELADAVEELLEEGRAKGVLVDSPLPGRETSAPPSGFLRYPGKVLVHGERIYVTDSGHHRIVECDLRGKVTRVFGSGIAGNEDGPAAAAGFRDPQGLAIHDDGLVVADTGNHLLRRIDLDSGAVRRLAGTGTLWRGEHVGLSAAPEEMPLRSPWDVVAAEGVLLIAMAGSHQIWLYDPARDLFGPFAGNGRENHHDGPLREASFAQPSGLALFGRYLFVADSEVSSVRAIDLQLQEVQTLTGKGLFDFGDADGPGSEARLQHPLHVCVGMLDEGPQVYVADTFNHKIRAIDLESLEVRTVLGDGTPASLYEPGGMDLFREGLLIADTNNHRLRVGDLRTGELCDFPVSG